MRKKYPFLNEGTNLFLGDRQCAYDSQQTGNMEIGQQTMNANQNFDTDNVILSKYSPKL